jgi:uncharacterized membrane protein
MTKGRLEAFSDGVIAIIITITILLFDVPEGNDMSALLSLGPLMATYLVSFIMVGTHWANHHHLLQVASHVNGKILWANLLYLFTLSFFPVATGWAGRSRFAAVPTRVYVIVNLLEFFSYMLLQFAIVRSKDCVILNQVMDESKKEALTLLLEVLALVCSFINPIRWASYVLLVAGAAPWIIPDLRLSMVYEQSALYDDD